MSHLQLGIVGAGAILEAHLRALAQLQEIRVSAVCDIDAVRRARAAERLGATAHADLGSLLDQAPDAVLVALPHGLHCEAAVAALAAGCHVVVEKPMAVSVAECNRMLAAADEAGRALLVAESAAAHPGVRRTGAAFAAGDLGSFLTGSIVNARYYFHETRPAWFLDESLSGGGMFANVGLHRLAVARGCLPGERAVTVAGTVGRHAAHPVEACTSALVRYTGGGSMLYEEVGYFPRPAWLNTGTHLVFEAGIVGWDDDTWRWQTAGDERLEPLGGSPGYRSVYEVLLGAARGEDCPDFRGRDFAADVAIVQAAYASAARGHEIDLRSVEWRIA